MLGIGGQSDISECDFAKESSHDAIFATFVTQVVFIVSHVFRLVTMEDSQAVVAHGMSNVVSELAKLGSDRYDVWIETRSHSGILVIHPEAIISRTSCSISNENVIRMRDPEAARTLISVEQTERRFCASNDVVLD